MLPRAASQDEGDMLKVWGRRSSFNVQKVLWLIGELAHEQVERWYRTLQQRNACAEHAAP
jgi:hypothetical protein